jgi:hypothetical protein
MRIWHNELIPKLCTVHLIAQQKEVFQIWDIITCKKNKYLGREYKAYCGHCGTYNENVVKCTKCSKRLDGYFYHPATKEYWNCPDKLWYVLKIITDEVKKRGYKYRELPLKPEKTKNKPIFWMSLEEQIEILKNKRKTLKRCKCNI